MSDLQCAATLLIARHGDAEYGHPSVLSDEGGWLSDKGVEQTTALAVSLAGRRVAAVRDQPPGSCRPSRVRSRPRSWAWSRAPSTGSRSSRSVPSRVGRRRRPRGLQSHLHGLGPRRPPQAHPRWRERERRSSTGYREALMSIADQFRGETVLVFSHGGVMSFVLPRISGERARRPRASQVPPQLRGGRGGGGRRRHRRPHLAGVDRPSGCLADARTGGARCCRCP